MCVTRPPSLPLPLCPSSYSGWRSALHLAAHPAPEYHRDDLLLRQRRQPSLHFHTHLTLTLTPPPAAPLHPCFALLLRCDTAAQFPGEYLHPQSLLADREHARHGDGSGGHYCSRGGRRWCDHRRRRPREFPAQTPSAAGRRREAGSGLGSATDLLRCTR